MNAKMRNILTCVLSALVLLCVVLVVALKPPIATVSANSITLEDVGKDSLSSSDRLFKNYSLTRWDDNGPVAVKQNATAEGTDITGMGLTRTFDVSEGKEFTIKFQVPILDHETRGLLTNQSTVSDNNFKVHLKNLNNGREVFICYWLNGNAEAWQNNTFISMFEVVENALPNEYQFSDWTSGVATNGDKPYTLGFNTTDYIKHDIATRSYGKGNFNDVSANTVLQNVFAGCECVEVSFSRDFLSANTQYEVKILQVNGQSMAKSGNTVNDNVAPIVPYIKQVNGLPAFELNTTYYLHCKDWFEETVNSNAIFYINPAYDILSAASNVEYHTDRKVNLEYGLLVTDVVSGKVEFYGEYDRDTNCLEFSFGTKSKYIIQVQVTDAARNDTLSTGVTVTFGNVVDFHVDGTSHSKVFSSFEDSNKTITLPTATDLGLTNLEELIAWETQNGTRYTPGSAYIIQEDITLTAIIKRYANVSFQVNGVANKVDRVEIGSTINLSKNTGRGLVGANNAFIAWKINGAIQAVTDSYTVTENVTVNAIKLGMTPQATTVTVADDNLKSGLNYSTQVNSTDLSYVKTQFGVGDNAFEYHSVVAKHSYYGGVYELDSLEGKMRADRVGSLQNGKFGSTFVSYSYELATAFGVITYVKITVGSNVYKAENNAYTRNSSYELINDNLSLKTEHQVLLDSIVRGATQSGTASVEEFRALYYNSTRIAYVSPKDGKIYSHPSYRVTYTNGVVKWEYDSTIVFDEEFNSDGYFKVQ